MKLWIFVSLLAVSAWPYNPFSIGSLQRNHGGGGLVGYSRSSMFCSADDNVFMGFGGKNNIQNRNRDEDEANIFRGDFNSASDFNTEVAGIPALPDPADRDPSESVRILEVNGNSIKMDELGPIIVNADGTLRRIENWATLTKVEQATTIKLISRRNRKRLDALKELQADENREIDQLLGELEI